MVAESVMETVPTIVFENMESSEFVQSRIEREINRLERFFGRGTSCRVVVRAPDGRQAKGGLFSVRIHIEMPGQRGVVVSRQPPERKQLADPNVAIHEAFRTARRQLQDQTGLLRGEVKAHDEQGVGTVTGLYPEDGYGLITTATGDEIHFDRSSMQPGEFETLQKGAQVSYEAHEGDYRVHARVARMKQDSG
ncbi:HPF/RaiA family ribosome-associated protein [Vineibacter terrae]|uniref:HPF/RaiA family ribosome-associated protein n=1 Tax=Vineibacter terrae TaxID=2586908 RepID=UPI002E33ECF3|nr:HPF/RaiA family ribosome-associated protein [Vineibacter terrae]HEX2885160.1 HPF/RaiA family ribosome-associated protein [Vineibacter terrae]